MIPNLTAHIPAGRRSHRCCRAQRRHAGELRAFLGRLNAVRELGSRPWLRRRIRKPKDDVQTAETATKHEILQVIRQQQRHRPNKMNRAPSSR